MSKKLTYLINPTHKGAQEMSRDNDALFCLQITKVRKNGEIDWKVTHAGNSNNLEVMGILQEVSYLVSDGMLKDS